MYSLAYVLGIDKDDLGKWKRAFINSVRRLTPYSLAYYKLCRESTTEYNRSKRISLNTSPNNQLKYMKY